MGLVSLFRCRFDNFAAFVLAALGADAVGKLRLMAVGALGESGFAQSVVSAAVLGARVGVSSFRIRHFLYFPGLYFRGLYFAGRSVPALFDMNVFECDPAIVARMLFTIAIGLIPTGAAHRADSFTGFTAHGLHGELQ
jgi:hypothetical protein